MVCTGTPEKKEEEKRKTRKRKRKENTQKRRKIKRKKAKWTSAEGAGESLGDKVAVCWYDQSCDGSSWWTNIRTTQKKKKEKNEKKKEKTEKKMRPDGRQNKKRVHRQQRKEQSYVQRLGQGRHKGHKKRTETDRQRCARSITFMLLRLDASCCVCASGKPNATTTKGRTPQPKANPTREKWG